MLTSASPASSPTSGDTPPPPLCWVTGAGGLIGNALIHSPHRSPRWRVRGLNRAELDLTDFAAVERAFHSDQPRAVLHCAALSKSPACQADPALAWRLNFDVTRHLAALASDLPFFFFSTDLVFDGQQGNYQEADAVHPLSVYGETKVAAEQVVLANPRHTVLRTSLNHGISPTGDRGFNEETLLAWQAGRTTRLFVDEFRSPIPAAATARATWELLDRGATHLFHLAGAERLSRWDIGQHLARQNPGIVARIEATSLRAYAGAPRPPDTSLNSSRAQAILSFPLPGYREVP